MDNSLGRACRSVAYASTRRIRSVCASPAGASRRVHAQWLLVSRPSQHCLSRAYEQAVVIAHLAQHKEGRVAQSCNRPDGRRALFPIFENQMGFILNIVCPQKLSDACFGAEPSPNNHRLSRPFCALHVFRDVRAVVFVFSLLLPKNPARLFF